MRPVPRRSFCALLLFIFCAGICARAAAPPAPESLVIGNPVAPLNGPWRFHPGDNMAWAQPGFDDSHWAPMDLTASGAIDPTLGTTGFLPGWTAKGYPHLTGYAWYRLRVQVAGDAGAPPPPLAILLPESVDDAYQVFIDGRLVGQFGIFHPNGVTFINSQPRAFPLPTNLPPGPITIAIRMWMDTATPFMSPDAGGLHGTPLLGQAETINAMLNSSWDQVDRAMAGYVPRIALLGIVTLLAFVLYLLDRREPAYLWLTLACALFLVNLSVTVIGYYVTWLPMPVETLLTDVLCNPLLFGLWVLFWGYWFGLPHMRRLHAVVWILVALLVVGVILLRPPMYGGLVPVSASAWLQPVTEVLKLAFGVVIFWIAWRSIRSRGVEGWLALIPILFMPVWLYMDELTTLHIYPMFWVHGIGIGLNTIGLVLTLAAVAVLMMRRFIGGLHDKQSLEVEMEQARQVQQVLIPEDLPTIPGFAIESEYRPARQVGGDFFQTLPLDNGAFLAIIGDVSGKGIPAAMTVSLLVGAVRTALLSTQNPAELLAVLNTRMVGRSQGGFTTCLIARISADGAVSAANAGHLAPYLNGREVAVSNGLPLGLSASAAYAETAFRLAPGDRLTLITDGVVEARSKTGELFGFERVAAIATQPAAAIAETAENFGKEDDITVLEVLRLAEPAPA